MSVESSRCVQLKSWLYSDLNLHVITATKKGKGLPKKEASFKLHKRKGEQPFAWQQNVEYNSLKGPQSMQQWALVLGNKSDHREM